MSNDAKKMSLENQITLCQNNAIEFVHACMSIALHEVFGVGRDRLDKVNRVRDELNGRMVEIMTRPAKRQRDQLTAAEQWITGLLPEGVETTLRVPVVKGVPKKRREMQIKMAIDQAATLEWRVYAAACARVLGYGTQRLTRLREETLANFRQLNEWVAEDGVDVAMEMLCRCARDAYKTDVQVLDVPDEAVLEDQRRGSEQALRDMEMRAVRQELSRMRCGPVLRVPVLPLSDDEVRKKIEAVQAWANAPQDIRRTR